MTKATPKVGITAIGKTCIISAMGAPKLNQSRNQPGLTRLPFRHRRLQPFAARGRQLPQPQTAILGVDPLDPALCGDQVQIARHRGAVGAHLLGHQANGTRTLARQHRQHRQRLKLLRRKARALNSRLEPPHKAARYRLKVKQLLG